MCTGDAMRLCGHEVPNVQRITACMARNRAHVSPGCRAVMEREHAAAEASRRRRVTGCVARRRTERPQQSCVQCRGRLLDSVAIRAAIDLAIDSLAQ